MSKINTMIKSFNEKLTNDTLSSLSTLEIEAIIRTEIETVLGINEEIKKANYQGIDQKKLKPVYYALARALNTDHEKTENYAKALKTKGLGSLPHTVLTGVWQEIIKDRTASSSYYPLDYARSKKFSLIKIISECCLLHAVSVAQLMAQGKTEQEASGEAFKITQSKFFEQLKENFPELYYYENYPEWVQDSLTVNAYFLLINAALVAALLAHYAVIGLFALINQYIIFPLLDLATNSKYLQYDAQILTMKKTLMLDESVELSREEMDKIYINQMSLSPNSQAHFLEQQGLNLQGMSQEKIEQYFQCAYIKTFLENSLNDENQAYFAEIDDQIQTFNAIKYRYSSSSLERQLAACTDELAIVQEIYQKIRHYEQAALHNAIQQEFYNLSGFQQIHSIANAIKDMATDKTEPTFDRIFRGLVLIVSSPLIFTSCAFQLLAELNEDVLMAIKLLSAELINAPLKVYSFFNTGRTAFEEPEVAERLLLCN